MKNLFVFLGISVLLLCMGCSQQEVELQQYIKSTQRVTLCLGTYYSYSFFDEYRKTCELRTSSKKTVNQKPSERC